MKLTQVDEHYCAKKYAINCNYLFRFALKERYDDLDLFDYSHTSILKCHKINDLNQLKEFINKLNEHFKRSQVDLMDNEERFVANKYRSISTIKISKQQQNFDFRRIFIISFLFLLLKIY